MEFVNDRSTTNTIVGVVGSGIELVYGENSALLHPLWLRERSREPGDVDARTAQRLHPPQAVDLGLRVVRCAADGDALSIAFSDGSSVVLSVAAVCVDLGWVPDPEAAPMPRLWDAAPDPWPTVEWESLVSKDVESHRAAIRAIFELGFVVVRGMPCVEGTVGDAARFFGRIAPTTFGGVFDVVSEPNAVDLAYTSVALAAHSDMPYRRPVPGLQLLHALANEAPGGDSTLVDGFAAVAALRSVDPLGYETLCTLGVDFRYDIGTDAMNHTMPIIERDYRGEVRCVRFSPRIDYAPSAAHATLDHYYRARRWLADCFDDPARRAALHLQAGEMIVFDNHRILHGRTAFDPTLGARHLQGCYADHDGIYTQWQLLQRDLMAGDGR